MAFFYVGSNGQPRAGSCCQTSGCVLPEYHSGDHKIPATEHNQRRYGIGIGQASSGINLSDIIPARVEPHSAQTIFRCQASGCYENHRAHYCKNCGNGNSDHRSGDCPRLQLATFGGPVLIMQQPMMGAFPAPFIQQGPRIGFLPNGAVIRGPFPF